MCVLHVTCKSVSFAEFLKKTTLPVYQAHEKGDVPNFGKRMPYDDFGFSCRVSEREWTDLSGQVEDSLRFLRKYGDELRALVDMHVVDDIRFDFPYSCRLDDRVFLRCDYLPPEFLRLAGDFGIGIELSHYPLDGDGGLVVISD